MNPPHVPGASAALRLVIGASLWFIRRPFLLSRTALHAIVVAAFTAAAVAAAFGAILASAVVLLLAAVPAAAAGYWAWLVRGDTPVVLLSLFKAPSFHGQSAAQSHLAGLRRFLESDDAITVSGPVIFRTIKVPISDKAAKRLLQFDSVLMVVRGSGDAGHESGFWDGRIWFGDSPACVDVTEYQHSVRVERSRAGRRSGGQAAAAGLVVSSQGELETARFFTSAVEIEQFYDAAKVLLVLLGEQFVAAPQPKEPRSLQLPVTTDDNLAPHIRGRALILEAEARRGSEAPSLILDDVEQRAFGPEPVDQYFARWVTAQWFAGENEGWSTPGRTSAAFARWCDRFAEDATLLMNYAACESRMDRDKAGRLLDQARRTGGAKRELANIHGQLAWADGRPRDALKHYRRASRFKRSVGFSWRKADCHAELGHRYRALRGYRSALRRDPSAIFAAQHARIVVGWNQLLPTWPPGWRSMLWAFMHARPRLASPALTLWKAMRPEDPYLLAWLTRHALIRGRVAQADRWATIDARFPGTNRLLSMGDMLVVLEAIGDPDLRRLTDGYIEHLEWLDREGVPRVPEAVITAQDQLSHAATWLPTTVRSVAAS